MTKLCLIKTNKTVPELYGLSGPFFDPVELSLDQITSMLNRGIVVYEVNPYDPTEKIRLNRFLANQVNFKKLEKKVEIKDTPSIVNTEVDNFNRKENFKNKHNSQNNPTKVKVADFQ